MKALYELIKQFEGCKLKAYKCPAGIWTCGWGTTGADVKPDTVWTQEQADTRMAKDAQKFVDGVLKVSPVLKDHPNKLAAVADFAYNCGLGKLQMSTLRKKIAAGADNEVPTQLARWIYGSRGPLLGLVRRRHAEATLYASS